MAKKSERELLPLARRLKALRIAEGLSQQDLAERAGLPLQRVFKIEQGAADDPKWSTIVKLAAGMGMSIGDFATALESDE